MSFQKPFRYALLPFCAIAFLPITSPAADSPQDGLRSLAKNFVTQMRQGFNEADEYYRTHYAGDLREQEGFTGIEDGEMLLLQIVLPKKVKLVDPVTAIKQGNDVMLSLIDFANIARFRIEVMPEERTAQGWFIREDKVFSLDLKTGEVLADKNAFQIREGDVLEQDGDLFIRADALSTWMDMDMQVSLKNQNILVENTEKWPVQAALDRKNRKASDLQTPPVMPLQEDPYEIVGPANIDINLRQEYRKQGDADKATKRTSYTLRSDSDLAKHTATAVLSGNTDETLASARLTLSRESAEPDLLGPLNARFYEFGDVTSSRVRQTGPAKNGLGMRATNKNPNVTTEATTTLQGEGTPGWDVEVYRGSQLLETGRVDDDGRYFFEDVILAPGENNFRIVQYGPFGEIVEDQQNLFAGTDLLNKDGTVYDVSVTGADTKLYDKDKFDPEDKGQPQIAAQFEKQIMDGVAARLGTVSGTVGDTRKNYLSSGITTTLGQSLVSLDGGYDIDGAWQTAASARRQFGRASGSLTAGYTSQDFGVAEENSSPASYTIGSNFRTPVGELFNRPVVYNTEHKYTAADNGSKALRSEMGLSGYINRLTFSQNFDRDWEEDTFGQTSETIGGTSNLTGNLFGTHWRASTNYDIYPERATKQYGLDLSKPIRKNLRGTLDIEHSPEDSLTKTTGALSFYGERATISPSLSYDSENNLAAFLNLGVGLAYEPHGSSVVFSGRSIAGMGGASVRVYLDHDGNNTFTEGDELLEGVTVEAVHSNRRAETDEKGIAFLPNLAAGRLTDVVVQDNSLPDAFWVPARKGVSVLPRAGNVTEIDFPIHIAGEVDGTIFLVAEEGNKTPMQNVRLSLHRAFDGIAESTTTSASDGFYIFDRVPPGTYFLLVNPDDAAHYKASSPQPQTITIGFEGTTIYGNPVLLNKGPSVGIVFPEDLKTYIETYPDVDFSALDNQKFILNLGSYNSNLMMALSWYRMKQRNPKLQHIAKPLVDSTQSQALGENGTHILRATLPGKTLEQARDLCLQVSSRGGVCTVEMLPEQSVLASILTQAQK